ncbi:protein terminus-like [Teleopsis dalmanni]|uniref:protein terminus-like n=1 Tax=Teleopsis dalmanni TaxID=139649 RepID=UPI0018CE6C41|nr:protein terminus-like [Teleopsis dalmanni]
MDFAYSKIGSQENIPSFTYSGYSPLTTELHHRSQTNPVEVFNCQTSYNISQHMDPYGKHYHGNNKQVNLGLTAEEKDRLQIIEDKGIDTLVMSNDNVGLENKEFLLNAATESLPSMLRLLFVKTNRIQLRGELYAKMDTFNFVVESTELNINHHFDIPESVEMLFMLLLEKVKMLMCSLGYIDVSDFKVQRIKVNIKMDRSTSKNCMQKLSLPLKYRVKNAAYDIDPEQLKSEHPKKESCDLDSITSIYKHYKLTGDGNQLLNLRAIDLYCFKLCHTSAEVYTEPFYLTSPIGVKENRSFIILEDVLGNFQRFMEITNPLRFANVENPTDPVTCIKCNTHYAQLVQLELHQRLECGDDFEIYELDNNYDEESDPNQFEIKTTFEKWMLFGVKNNENV